MSVIWSFYYFVFVIVNDLLNLQFVLVLTDLFAFANLKINTRCVSVTYLKFNYGTVDFLLLK